MMIRIASVSPTFSERDIHAVRMLKNNDNIMLDKLRLDMYVTPSSTSVYESWMIQRGPLDDISTSSTAFAKPFDTNSGLKFPNGGDRALDYLCTGPMDVHNDLEWRVFSGSKESLVAADTNARK